MNLIRKYFLLVAKRPVAYVFYAVLIFYFAARLIIGLSFNSENTGEEKTASLIVYILSFASFFVFVVVAWINDTVVRSKVTVLKLKQNEMGLLIYPEGTIETYERPVWAQPLIAVVEFPKEWNWRIKEGDELKIEISIAITVNEVICASVPILVTFIFSGSFNQKDLISVLNENYYVFKVHKVFNFGKLVKKKIADLNMGENHDLISQDALGYLQGKVVEEQLLCDIKGKIKFPDKLFDNVAKTDIEIGLPKFNFSKEWKD